MERVFCGYPVGGSVHPAFCKALLDMQRFELEQRFAGFDEYELLPIDYSASLYVQENRNILVDLAREAKADWVLQLDTDHSFQPTLLRQLMKTADAEHRPIVFGLYTNVSMAPAAAEGAFLVTDMIFREVANGEYENIVPPTDCRPFRVDAAGSGVLLTHVSVFDKIEYPWFWLDMIQIAGRRRPQVMNEDIAFCRLAREAGYQLWCDPLAEAVHYKSVALVPSTFRHFMARAEAVQKELEARC